MKTATKRFSETKLFALFAASPAAAVLVALAYKASVMDKHTAAIVVSALAVGLLIASLSIDAKDDAK